MTYSHSILHPMDYQGLPICLQNTTEIHSISLQFSSNLVCCIRYPMNLSRSFSQKNSEQIESTLVALCLGSTANILEFFY